MITIGEQGSNDESEVRRSKESNIGAAFWAVRLIQSGLRPKIAATSIDSPPLRSPRLIVTYLARVLLLVLLVISSPAAAELITNGSFESEELASPIRVAISNATGWNSTGGLNLLERGVNGTSDIAAQDGSQFVSMGHSSASGSVLSQAITTVPGTSYDVSFWTREIQGNATPPPQLTLTVRTDSETLATLPVPVSENTLWVQSLTSFVATSAATIIEFTDASGGSSSNIALDNVSVTVVPEPASLALACCGLIGLYLTARRRNR